MLMFLPSTYPSSRKPCCIAWTRDAEAETELASSIPIRGVLAACCASTEPQRANNMAERVRTVIFFFMFFFALSTRRSSLAFFSSNNLIRSRQHVRRNRQADLFGGFKIDHKLKLHWLLHREIGWLSTF